MNPSTGDLYREGDLIRDPVLSSTYKRLALSHDPVQLFYSANGELAREIVDEFASNGNPLSSSITVSDQILHYRGALV